MRFSLVFLIGFHRYDDICKLFIVCVLFFGQKAHDFNIKIVILHCFVKTMFIDVTMTLWKKRHCTLCFWSFELPLQFSIKDKCRGDASEVYIRTQPVVCKRVYTLMHTFRVYYICFWGYRICLFYWEGCGRPKRRNEQRRYPLFISNYINWMGGRLFD